MYSLTHKKWPFRAILYIAGSSSLTSHPIILQPSIIHRWPIFYQAKSPLFGPGLVIARPFITMQLPTRKLDMLPHTKPTTDRLETELATEMLFCDVQV